MVGQKVFSITKMVNYNWSYNWWNWIFSHIFDGNFQYDIKILSYFSEVPLEFFFNFLSNGFILYISIILFFFFRDSS